MIITEMDRSACLALLDSARSGRLACAREDQPYVVPITFARDGGYLYSFSLVGQKIAWMRDNPNVCVQADEFIGPREWKSVVVTGRYEELPDRIGSKSQRERAWSLLSQHANWWEPGGLKPVADAPTPHLFYRVSIDELTGRHARPAE
jgi:nitroimidazol reductase NimA-like FMN-containing flavoprotein (pyridoxamine 5'-phosphate oxidase superfamily)